ncbi:MAG: T9SS type A sorting domain-containing protein, partial [Saprospiraceae bacterium]|nr:T9SS type A sorting domain-containing protein [Saprospiraceae bacterium]
PGEGMTSGNFAVFSEMLTTSFDAAPGISAPAEFTLRLRAKAAGSLRNMMNVSSSVTKAEAYGKDAERQSVALRFNGKEVRGVGFEVYQNQPNPWINRTVIGFHLPEADDVTLTVFDESGRQLYRQVGDFGKGYNAFTLDKELVNTTGLLYYQVSTSEESVTMKMIQTK